MLSRIIFGLLLGAVVSESALAPPGSIPLKLKNAAGVPVSLYWKNVFEPGNKLVLQHAKPIRNNSAMHINSYVDHEFAIKIHSPSHPHLVQEVSFVKGPAEETITFTMNDLGVLVATSTDKISDVSESISAHINTCISLVDYPVPDGDSFPELIKCVTDQVSQDVLELQDSKDELIKYRDLAAERLRNYTCADHSLTSSTPVRSEEFLFKDRFYDVDVYFENDHAQIMSVNNFISTSECDILRKHASPRLYRATVAGPDGTNIVSENRKANQASYDFNANETLSARDPLKPLYERVLGFVNGRTNFDLKAEGQEGFTIIQYNVDDEYTPHCDGQCDGERYSTGGRVATAVLYCQVPEVGGSTTFTKADVHVQPRAGMATFFTYVGSDGFTDSGFTEHSGCPVVEGEKWITTFWMRMGVSNEHPHSRLDPQGVELASSSADDLL